MARKVRVRVTLSGRPKEMLLTPSVAWTPSSFLTRLSASKVLTAWSCWAETVSVRQSMRMSFLGIPAFPAALTMVLAKAMRSSTLCGMPRSMVRPTIAAPYFFAMGRIAPSFFSLASTELTIAFPLAYLRPASMAAGSEESIISGRSTTPWTACTTSFMTAASSMPGTPTLMSSTSAPASAWAMASFIRVSMSCEAIACLTRFFPVGLMRSPMTLTLP